MSYNDFEVRQNDLLPPLTVDVTDDGEPIDMSGAVSVTVIGYMNEVQKFSRLASSVGLGEVVMNWVVGDTDTIGPMKIFVRIVWSSRTLTVEPDNGVQVLRVP